MMSVPALQLPEALGTRRALPGDIDFLYRLHVATMRTYVEQTWGWDDSFQEALFRDRFIPGEIRIITLAGKDVGMLSLQERTLDFFLRTIEIAPGYQGRGIGTLILERILAEAAGKHKPVVLRVLKVNPARALYHRLGFSVVEETPTHFHMTNAIENRLSAP